MKFADFLLRGWGGWGKDIHYALIGNVTRGKSALLRLVVRNGFADFVGKVFARRKLLPGKFWVFVPLLQTLRSHQPSLNKMSTSVS